MATVFFSIAGIAACRALGVSGGEKTMLGRWMMAPALGLSLYTPFAFLILSLIGFSVAKVLITWAIFTGSALAVATLRPRITTGLLFPEITNRHAAMLIVLAMLWGMMPASLIYPFPDNGALYTNTPLADHVKIAFTDAIVREGMPLKNPFYAPAGKRILLSYSYGFYLAGAFVKSICHSTGWSTEVAMTWFAAMAMVLFLAAIASAIAGSAAGGFWLVMVSAIGFCSFRVLPLILGTQCGWLIGVLEHGLEVLVVQLSWAPQHTVAALAVIVLLWLCSAVLAETTVWKRWIVAIALAAAAGFEDSSWVGGVALAAAVPILLLSAALLRLPRKHYLRFAATIASAVLVCAGMIVPLLRTYLAGKQQGRQDRPIALAIFPTTLLEQCLSLHGVSLSLARIVLFWVHLLPLSFGVAYLVGLPALIWIIPRSLGERTFKAVALAATIGFLLVSQFIKSTIRENDLGWRAVNVPVMFLSIFAAVAIADLLNPRTNAGARYLTRWIPPRAVSIPIALALLTLGLFSTGAWVGIPRPQADQTAEQLQMHEAFAHQQDAWRAVRHWTKKNDLVQANPNAFSKLPPWSISLPFHLFADRSCAYSCEGTGKTYAFRYSWEENTRQGELVASIFSANPKRSAIQKVRQDLNVKALLVTPADPVWKSQAIEKSGVYRLAAATADYRVFVATAQRPRVRKPATSAPVKIAGDDATVPTLGGGP